MPCYVKDPLNPGKRIDVIKLQQRNPQDPLPPYLIGELFKRDLWERREALLILAGFNPHGTLWDDGAQLPNRLAYLDGTTAQQLSDAAMTHPLYTECLDNYWGLQGYAKGQSLDETKTPTDWLAWAKGKDFVPYWQSEIKPAPVEQSAAKVEDITMAETAELARHVVELARLLESKTPAPLQFENGTRLTKYLKRGTWTPEQAAFLVCGIDADTVQNQFFGKQIKHGKLLTGERITEQSSTAFLHADEVLELWNWQANPPGKIAPVDFVEWCESNKIDATWLSEIKTAPEEQSDTPAPKVEAVKGITTHRLGTKNMPLDAEIVTAKEKALDKTSSQSVWDALIKMASTQRGCLIGEGDLDEIKYGSRIDPKIFTKRMLADRMRGRKKAKR